MLQYYKIYLVTVLRSFWWSLKERSMCPEGPQLILIWVAQGSADGQFIRIEKSRENEWNVLIISGTEVIHGS